MKKLRVLAIIMIVLAALTAFAACTGDDTNTGDAVTAIRITEKPGGDIYYSYNGVGQLNYELTPSTAVVNVLWDSSDKTVATINAQGRYTQKGVGSTTITATVEGTEIKDSFTLKIVSPPVFNIEMDGETVASTFRLDGTGVNSSMLSLVDGKIVFDSDENQIVNPAITIEMAESMEVNTLYELSFKLKFIGIQHNSSSSALRILSGRRVNMDDWYHIFPTTTISTTAVNTVHGVFTSANTNLNSIEVTVFEKTVSTDSDFSMAAKLEISDVVLTKVEAADVVVVLEQKNTTSVTMNAVDQALNLTRSVKYGGVSLPGGQRDVWATSDPTVVALAAGNDVGFDGKFILKKAGTATISVTPYGIAGVTGDSYEITVVDGTQLPEPKSFSVEYNGEELVLAENQLVLGVDGGDRNAYINNDDGTLVVDTTGASRFKWPAVKLTLPEGKELEKNSMYYIKYDIDITELEIADGSLVFKVGSWVNVDGWAHFYVYTNASKGTMTVECMFLTALDGNTAALNDLQLFAIDNSNEMDVLKLKISNVVIEKAAKEDLTLTINGGATATLSGTSHTFSRSGLSYKGKSINAAMMTQWTSDNTAVVNFTNAIDGISTLSTGTANVTLGIAGVGGLFTQAVTVE